MIGQQFGNYRAVSLLGEGGMGAVYLAEHPAIGRRVAVKVLHKNYIRDENLLTRFLNEARAANAIRHPNIIEILDSGTIADGTPFLVMELLEGESLGTRIRRVGALSLQTSVEFCYQTASALGAAHKKGIVHRDLKPDNLFVVPDPHDPDRERIKVLDFGIAKLQQSANDSVKTRTGTLMGTPIYMSPEQCRGTKTVDHRSDIYSLGIIFFEMLCGQPPFVSEGFGELVNMHLNVAPPAPSSQNPDISPTIDAIVLKMLAKNPEERFADMGELQAALKSSGGSMFAVRGTQPSSPEMKNTAKTAPKAGSTTGPNTGPNTGPKTGPTTGPLGASTSNPKLRDTTFSTGVGERVDGDPAEWKTGKTGSKGKAAMVFVLAAAAAVGGGVFLFRDGEKAGVQHEIVAQPAAPADKPATTASATAAPTPDPTPQLPIAPPHPAIAKTVTVNVQSDPAGANVLDDASGGMLGVTPLVLNRPRGGALKLRLEKQGYLPNPRAVSLDDDQTIELTLEHKPEAKPAHVHKSHAPSGDSEPAKL
jgi:eukaryotic-like serine/threonine-protein kinase